MIVISPEQMPVTLSSGSLVYDGKTKASGAAVIATVNGEPLTLNDDDITVTNDGINVGTYNYQLNQTGLEKLQTLVGDDFTVVVGDPGTITITPAVVDVVLNDGSFTYDGNTAASAAKGLVATVNGTPVDLDNSDIEVTDDGVDAGNYAYQLNDAGLAKVQLVVGSNYQVSVAVTGTITITPASITAALSDGGFTYDGATKASEATGLTATANSQALI
ncbi:MBG domain-containing protein [Lacticaseibacillus thailandensis]|uniref:MBG domain-containing protein n=1 Tax=Lacticaseibacillus thailandensis TaxID=381741 RepID=UPI0006D04A87|nr:MBG domain-containing protein [Lacticaseibacillus thailandensis]